MTTHLLHPLCITVDGLVGSEICVFIRRLSDQLATKWDRPYNIILNWVRTKISFALVCSTDLCIRGSHTKWCGMNFEDGLSIKNNFYNSSLLINLTSYFKLNRLLLLLSYLFICSE